MAAHRIPTRLAGALLVAAALTVGIGATFAPELVALTQSNAK
jgi:hypothetical protein